MLDTVLNLIKNTVSQQVNQNTLVPEDKKADTVRTTAEALGEGIQQNFNLSNMSSLMGLFNNNTSTNSNPILNNISATVSNQLVQRVGLSQGIASSIAASVVPMVMNALSNKVNDPNEKGFSLESLVQSFSGSGNSGGIMGTIGKLFE